MFTRSKKQVTGWIACLIIGVGMTADVEAQPFRNGGGPNFSGGSRGGRDGGFLRNGGSGGGAWQGERPQGGNAASQANRQKTAKDLQTRQQEGNAASREDWQSHANEGREDRQEYRTNAREDWQDYGESGGGYYYRGYGYPAYPAGGVAAGIAIGSTMTAAAFNQQKASCTTFILNGITYYQCGSTWYQPSTQSGSVTYIVVNPPK